MNGLVIKSTGKRYSVLADNHDSYQCVIRGKFRLDGLPLRNPLAVGDEVQFERSADAEPNTGSISKIKARRNYLCRQSPRQKHKLQLLAANVDLAVLIVTVIEPMLKQGFIDRFLMMTEPRDIPACIVFNKLDLYSEKEMRVFETLNEIYCEIPYQVMGISALKGSGLERFKELISGKTTVVCGQSGVGKSTLLNALYPGLALKTKTLSSNSGKGQHSTTFSEMHQLDDQTRIIDTPGIKTLSFNNLEPQDVAHNFVEFFKWSVDCKFSDCSHRNEPHCAIKNAIAEGEISELRYLNYLQIVDEIEEQNYWERHRDM